MGTDRTDAEPCWLSLSSRPQLWSAPAEGTTEADVVARRIDVDDVGSDPIADGYVPITDNVAGTYVALPDRTFYLHSDPGSQVPIVQAALPGMTIHRDHTFDEPGRYLLNCSTSKEEASATSPARNYPVLVDVADGS